MAEHALVVYYSRTGNTERMAEIIHRQVGGEMHRIIPAESYPQDYNAVVNQAGREIREGYLPALSGVFEDIVRFERIFVGSPNWWSTIAPPVATFLASYDFSGKTIFPFCTHGGGGLGRIQSDIAKSCPQAAVMTCLGVYGDGGTRAESQVIDWLMESRHDLHH